ncbi:hypothetical protein GCM10010493_75920 [Streptomyces lavendulae subsp. grasserius]
MPRIALTEPQCTGQASALPARTTTGDASPIGLFRMSARGLSVAGAMHGWDRYESGSQLTSLDGGPHA